MRHGLVLGVVLGLAACVELDPAAQESTRGAAVGPSPCAGQGSCVHVDLAAQRLTAYDAAGTAYLATSIASGLPGTPTRPGSYRVWLRVPAQWMTGPGYHVYTRWVQYFDGERALHSADWLSESQYGRPQSHGCVNMRDADAKLVWDHTSGETPVIVTGSTPGGTWCVNDECAPGQTCGTATPDPCSCGDAWIDPGDVCDIDAATGGGEPDDVAWCPDDRCADGERCGTATDDPCACDGAWIGPGAICVFGSGGSAAGDEDLGPSPGDPCLDWQCAGDLVCVDGVWRTTSCTAEAGVARVCRAGWCDWP